MSMVREDQEKHMKQERLTTNEETNGKSFEIFLDSRSLAPPDTPPPLAQPPPFSFPVVCSTSSQESCILNATSGAFGLLVLHL